MDTISDSSFIYERVIQLIDLNEYSEAINFIKRNIKTINLDQDIALAYIYCGFINFRLGDYSSSIRDFSEAIEFEKRFNFLTERSKDISYNARSASRYKNGEFKGSIEDKRHARKIRLIEIESHAQLANSLIDYQDIFTGALPSNYLEPKYKLLSKISKLKRSKYDLIEDFKKVITNDKKREVINKLEKLSDLRFENGDYKGSIKAIRRAEKFY